MIGKSNGMSLPLVFTHPTSLMQNIPNATTVICEGKYFSIKGKALVGLVRWNGVHGDGYPFIKTAAFWNQSRECTVE